MWRNSHGARLAAYNNPMHAAGTFDVKTSPIASTDPWSRFKLDKRYYGDLEADAIGEMLTAGDPQKGSAGYVAMEKVTGTLAGKRGAFALQHAATMDAGSQSLSVVIVPGSGTAELAGITGTMTIHVAAGKHSYTLDYVLR